MTEMLVGIKLGGVSRLARLAVHLHQGVLTPSPRRLSVVGEDEVPIVVFIATVAKVVRQQEEGMLGSLPVHTAIATLALAHHKAMVGIALAHLGQIVATFPLGAYSCDILLKGFVVENLLHIVKTVGVDGT